MVDNVASLVKQIKENGDIFLKSRLLQYLRLEKNFRVIDLAKETGYSSSYICHLLRLKKVPEAVVDGYYSKAISSSHIFILSRLNDDKQMIELYEKILSNNLTVEQTENDVRDYLYKVKSVGDYVNRDDLKQLKSRIKEKYPGLDITVIQTRVRGKIILEIRGDLEKSSKIIKLILEKLSG